MSDQNIPIDSEVSPSSYALERKLVIGFVFGFFVLILLVLVGDIRKVGQHVQGFRWELLPLVLALTLFNYTLRFFKWHYYLGQIGVRQLSLFDSARLFVAGFPLSVTPGKVGEALKAVWLNRATGIPVARGVSVVVAERISDGLAMVLLSTLGVIALPRFWPVFLLVLCLLLGIVVISQIRPLAEALLSFGERIPLANRFAHLLRDFYEGSFLLFRPGSTLLAVCLGAVSWLGEGLAFYIILIGLGIQPGWQALSTSVFVLSFSTILGAISALPGGLGAAEASIAGLLALLLHQPAEIAAAATILIRFTTLWFGVSLGFLVWAGSRTLLGLKQ